MKDKREAAVGRRYGALAKKSCRLSCGAALHYADVLPGETCVDLGSGRGADLIRMAETSGPAGRVYGIDISAGMLEEASRRLEESGIGNADLIKAPFHETGLPDNCADVLISNCSLNHSAEKPRVWKEIARILKPGGRFIVSDIYSSETVPAAYAGDPEAVAECWAGAVTRPEYLEMIEDAGFYDITVIEESEPYEKGKIVVSSITLRGKVPLKGTERSGS